MRRFRVLQFNMQYGMGWDAAEPDAAPIDLEATIAEIRRHDADIMLLQEVEQAKPDGGQAHPAPNYERLRAAFPGHASCFAYPRPDPRELPFGIGLAIFSRFPLTDVFQEDLHSPAIPFEFHGQQTTPTDRVLVGARATLEGQEVLVLNTHLLAFFMLNASSERHGEQRRQVAEHLRRATLPTILGGDFNVPEHESLVAQFAAAGFSSVQTREVTWHRRPYVLDHIFYNAPLRCLAHRVVPTAASDHHVLVADFGLV